VSKYLSSCKDCRHFCANLYVHVCVRLQKDKLNTNVIISYLLSACVSLAGFGNLMQDVLWCFSQVKGTIDIGVTEGKFIFPFVAVIRKNLFATYILPNQFAGVWFVCCWNLPAKS